MRADVLPLLKRGEPEYSYVADDMSEAFTRALDAALQGASRRVIERTHARARMLARRMVEQCDESTTESLRASVNAALGVDIQAALQMQSLGGVLEAAQQANVALIKSIPQQYLDRVSTQVLTALQQGRRYGAIVEAIQKETDVTERRAKLIARDQTSKLNSAITEARQTALGIEEYEWVSSNDERVRESHAENDGKVFRWDSPPETGHPGHDVNCRCSARPIINLDNE
ncbi:phage head morphogenesis protein, SPP1 gp7 family [Paraburkholderia atlantica]|uniref:Phage head morphogenesis protein, SPP1 gp7 family n=1 Tax=Paraburkholderia atlantica TaxID=2654982 RepID=D5WMD9_PARAM|nr:phage minor head protein [Paraburkholderia atlantica]ADG20385.1 phage head morphogenesis protein, SPP1 gp7 family [Paraburkholderia atlantica]